MPTSYSYGQGGHPVILEAPFKLPQMGRMEIKLQVNN